MSKKSSKPKQALAATTAAVGLVLALIFMPHVAEAQQSSTPPGTTAPTNAPPSPNQPSPVKNTGVSAPTAFIGVASATGNGFVYYHGGQINKDKTEYSKEFIALDVTRSWDTSSPAWINLTIPTSSPGFAASGHSATMSKDLSTLFLTAPVNDTSAPFLYQYNVKTGTWSSSHAPAAQAITWTRRKEAQFLTDPKTGAIWYIGGRIADTIDTNEIDRFLNGAWNANIPVVLPSTTDGPKSTITMNKYSSSTAHLFGNRIYIFGGITSGNGPRSYQSFQNIPWINISTSPPTIGSQLTLGSVPSGRDAHCSVLTDRNKVIIFGGRDANSKTTLSDIWSLDLDTFTWQQIIPVNNIAPRYDHTCNIVGANMIVYGGQSSPPNGEGPNIAYVKDTQVFDIVQSLWMTTYSPKEDTTPISKPHHEAGPNGNKTDGRGLSTGAIVGIVAAVLAVIGSLLGLFIYKRRQKRIAIREAEMEKQAYMASLGYDGEGHGNGNRNSVSGSSASHRRHKTHRNKNLYGASPHSTSTRRLNGGSIGGSRGRNSTSAANAPGMGHNDLSGIEAPTSGTGGAQDDHLQYSMPPEETSGGAQYLMQQLPDGTIAVQPVYFDHRSIPIQTSPNVVYSETSSLGGFLNSSLGQLHPFNAATSTSGSGTRGAGAEAGTEVAGYIAPPTSTSSVAPNATTTTTATTTPVNNALAPSSSSNDISTTTIPAPTHNPFASPILAHSPSPKP